MDFTRRIFDICDDEGFNDLAIGTFRHQYNENLTYQRFADAMGIAPADIIHYSQIPFLPILFFKTHYIQSGNARIQKTFLSSGTTGIEKSRHPVVDLDLYRESVISGFKRVYGSLDQYDIFALVPSPTDNPDSSLIFMVGEWIKQAGSDISGFYLNDFSGLAEIINQNIPSSRKQLLIGVSYALMDFADSSSFSSKDLIVMETGGMKGKRKELIREELHSDLKEKLGVPVIHSEYGMTELLSQAYSQGEGRFVCPPWMKIVVRDPDDPLQLLPAGKTGCLNIIDLANYHSCSFIATDDLGRMHPDNSFEVLGRFDSSMARGCNLLVG